MSESTPVGASRTNFLDSFIISGSILTSEILPVSYSGFQQPDFTTSNNGHICRSSRIQRRLPNMSSKVLVERLHSSCRYLTFLNLVARRLTSMTPMVNHLLAVSFYLELPWNFLPNLGGRSSCILSVNCSGLTNYSFLHELATLPGVKWFVNT